MAEPAPGEYRCRARVGVTPDAEIGEDGEVVHIHEPGEVVHISRSRQQRDGRWRGHGPEGWVSFVSEKGNRLLEPLGGSPGRRASGGGGGAPRLQLPTAGEWQAFYGSVGLDGTGPIDTSTVARAVTELLPGFNRTHALAAAYKALELNSSRAIEHEELEMLFRHLLFFDERWQTVEELRHEYGERLALDPALECCDALLGDRHALQDLEADFGHLARGGESIAFDMLLTWLSRRAVGSLRPSSSPPQRTASSRSRSPLGLRPAARTPTPAWALEGLPPSPISPEAETPVTARRPVRATVRVRGIADRVRVHGESGQFGSGFAPGTRLFADATCVASEVPKYLHTARVLQLPMHEERERVDSTTGQLQPERLLPDYVSFGPCTADPIQVYILFAQRRFVPAWLQRGFARTGDVVRASQRVNKRADAVRFTLDVWKSKRTYSEVRRDAGRGSPGQLHPEPSRRPGADLVKLGGCDLDNVALMDETDPNWDRDMQPSDEHAARSAGKTHNYVVLVLPAVERAAPEVAARLTAVPQHRQSHKSEHSTVGLSSVNPKGFGSTTGFRAKSPKRSAVAPSALKTQDRPNPPSCAMNGTTASSRARSRSPKPRARSPAPVAHKFEQTQDVNSERRKELKATYERMRVHQLRAMCRDENLEPEGDKQLLVSKLLDKLAPSKELVPKPAFGTSSPKPAASRRGTSPARLRAKSPGYSSDASQRTQSQNRLLTSPARLRPKSRTSTPKEKGFGSGAERIVRASSPGHRVPPVARQKGYRSKSPASRAKSPRPASSGHEVDTGDAAGSRVLAQHDGTWREATVTQSLSRGKQVVVQFDGHSSTEVVSRSDVLTTGSARPSTGRQPESEFSSERDEAQREMVDRSVQQMIEAAFEEDSNGTVELQGRELGDEQFIAVTDELAKRTEVLGLKLQLNRVGARGGALLGAVLKQGRHQQLTNIDLSANSLGDDGASKLLAGIAEASLLEQLDLSDNNLGIKSVKALDVAITGSAALRTLKLRSNNLGGSGMWQLADSLTQESALTSLDLEANSLGDTGGRALGLCLHHNTGLQRLVIANNDIRDVGGVALANGLAHNGALLELNAGKNRFGARTAESLASIMSNFNTTLCALDLRNTNVERTEEMKTIDAALQRNDEASQRASPAGSRSPLESWCHGIVHRLVPQTGVARTQSQSDKAGFLLEELRTLLRQKGMPNGAATLRAASPPIHRNTPPERASPSASATGSPRGSTGVHEAGSARRTRASSPAARRPESSHDPRASLAYVEKLYKEGAIPQSVYEARRSAIEETIPGELSGVWQVEGETSDGRSVREHISLEQLRSGEIRKGPPLQLGEESTEPDTYEVHSGRASGDQITFVQKYDSGDETRWSAVIRQGDAYPELVEGTWRGPNFSGSFTATLIQPAGAYIESAEAEEIGDAHSRAEAAFRGTAAQQRRVSKMHEGSTVDIYDPDMETVRSKWIGLSETQLIIGNSKSAPGREPRVIPLESITDVVQGCRGVRAGSAPEAPWRSFCIALGAQGRVQCVAASDADAAMWTVGLRMIVAELARKPLSPGVHESEVGSFLWQRASLRQGTKGAASEYLTRYLQERGGRDHRLDARDLRSLMADLGETELSEDEIEEMIREADGDGDGLVTRDEFLRMLQPTSRHE